MKKIIKFLPAMAILLASGLAIATTSKVSTPNVYWNGSQWQNLEGNYICTESPNKCTAFRDSNGQYHDVESGDYQPI